VKLRSYKPTDLEPLLALWWESWHSSASFRHPKPLSDWRSRWEGILEDHDVVVAEADGELLGFAALDVPNAALSQIFVAPHAKRRGIGRALFHWAVTRCPKGLTLKTLVENSESRAFYRCLGMAEGNRGVNAFNGREEIEYAL
jgi:GNAT superfamily N-acetyltransferase